ncbi:hypothetical protein IE81DRAFT_258772 [Ceraceosorus guamensis]|uniref:Uncharacterized protein n=1 Tax=Ceraceosorus guamensis TaxID=1522189 RepID=A0A316VWA4_9BASI|nr:hypothetical protein IE81DRAFT_258772 [Ceraceosorus guamensis]PWN39735.1 hypothetical protein IE81DRAFT_258772 [Ceraceosorus guamensis]
MFGPLAIAGTVFLALYAILFVSILQLVISRPVKEGIGSRWFILFFHVLVRLASQAVAIAFGVLVWKEWQLLVVYLVLAVEGYFSLVLFMARQLVWFEHHAFGTSWLAPSEEEISKARKARGGEKRALWKRLLGGEGGVMPWIHWLLIGANAMIITGGSLLTSGNSDLSTSSGIAGAEANWSSNSNLQTCKVLRAVGQSIFLLINIGLAASLASCAIRYKNSMGKWHLTLVPLVVAWPFLAARGAFGIAQAVDDSLIYYNPAIYDKNGLSSHFVLVEYLAATMTEWIACALLLSTRHFDAPEPIEQKSDVESSLHAKTESHSLSP